MLQAILSKPVSEMTEDELAAKERYDEAERRSEAEAVERKRKAAEAREQGDRYLAEYMERLRSLDARRNDRSIEWFVRELEQMGGETRQFRLDCAPEAAEKYLQAAYAAEVRRRGARLVADDNTRAVIRSASQWLTEGRKPGLLLRGYVGVGKTTMMLAMRDVVNLMLDVKMEVADARKIAARCRTSTTELERLESCPLLGIDDLGTEPVVVRNYGNEMSPIAELIASRYSARRFTVITTNLAVVDEDGAKADELRKVYGDRIYDRIREMFNFIVYDGRQQSYRR